MKRADTENGRGTSGGRGRWTTIWLTMAVLLLLVWGSSAWWGVLAQASRIAFECGSGVIGARLAAEPEWSASVGWAGEVDGAEEESKSFQWLPRVDLSEPDPGVDLPGWIFVVVAGGMAGLCAWWGRRARRVGRESGEDDGAAEPGGQTPAAPAEPEAPVKATAKQPDPPPAKPARSRGSSKPDTCASCGGDTTDAALASDGSVTCPACGHTYKASYAEIVARTRRRKKADG